MRRRFGSFMPTPPVNLPVDSNGLPTESPVVGGPPNLIDYDVDHIDRAAWRTTPKFIALHLEAEKFRTARVNASQWDCRGINCHDCVEHTEDTGRILHQCLPWSQNRSRQVGQTFPYNPAEWFPKPETEVEVVEAVEEKKEEVKPPVQKTRIVKKLQHDQQETLIDLLKLGGINIYLRGPAGSGKTTAGQKAAEAMKLNFYCQSMGPQTSQANLLGYMDANGKYVPGLMYKPFTEGGVMLIDEIDNSNASVVTVLNSALANDYCSFPNGMKKKHKNFRCIASGNTFGKGADALYIGRQQLDAATLNRFVVINWDYDEEFETGLVQRCVETKHVALATGWVKYVQQLRAAANQTGVKVVFSPRQSMNGARMLAADFPRTQVEAVVLWNSVAADDKAKVLANIQ